MNTATKEIVEELVQRLLDGEGGEAYLVETEVAKMMLDNKNEQE